MAGEWETKRLGEVAELNPDAIGRDWPHPHIRYIDISSVGVGQIEVPPQWMKLSDAPSRAKRLVRKGDTVLSTVRPNRRSMFFASHPGDDWVVSTGFSVLRPNIRLVDPRFLYTCIFNQTFTEYLITREKGAAYPAVSPEDIANAEIPFPPLKVQQAIAHILGTLDDKIELNRRMSETLEAMARALFKSWFVDFDPVRAKAEGRDPGLPQPLADLFPARLVDSELGEIPEGWEVGAIGDLAEVASGKRPEARFSHPSPEASVPLWGGNGPMAFVLKPLVNEPILLTGRVGTLGSVFRITGPCWPSDNTLVVRANQPSALEYLFFQLRQIDFASLNRGSTQPLLTQTDLKSQRIVLPVPALLSHFSRVASSMYRRIDETEEESRTLAALRDTLLPKLISGELRVKDAESFIRGGAA